jgi:enoyl-CoA hydratase/carnithine racemase
MENDLIFNVDDGVATLKMNRPKKLNAFTAESLQRLCDAIDECQNRKDILIVVLTGSGDAFCSGADMSLIGENADNRPHATKQFIWETIQRFPKRLSSFDKPIIAAVNGVAAGGGMDLALACDIRVASENARFTESYVKLGLLPGGGGAWFLPQLVGESMAMELLLSGDIIDAQCALRVGLVNHVWPPHELEEKTLALAKRIAQNPPLSVTLIKRSVKQGARTDMLSAFDLISSHIAIAKNGPDHEEALAAYGDHRKGQYRGF